MKTTFFALSLLGLFLVPTGAFAHDKHKHHDRDRDCDRDRHHYDSYRCEPRRYYYYDNYRPYGCAPRYYQPYDCDRRDYGFGGFRLWIR